MRHRSNAMWFCILLCLTCPLLLAAIAEPARAQLLASGDLSRLRSVGGVALSPDNRYLAYTITMRDRPGRLRPTLGDGSEHREERPPGG